jgi:hypothetical protein
MNEKKTKKNDKKKTHEVSKQTGKKLDYDPECISKYRVYERKDKTPNRDRGIIDITDKLFGQYSQNDQGREYLSGYQFPLSTKYRRLDMFPRNTWSGVCPPKINEEKLKKQGAWQIHDWVKIAEKKYSVTIKDILKLPNNKTFEVLTFHRNIGDDIERVNKRGTIYSPKYFFRLDKNWFIKKCDLQGTILFHKSFGIEPHTDFEFDIEYSPGNWYPLQNGYLPAYGDEG